MSGRFEPIPPSATQVRAYRDKTGAGMVEAKRELTRLARSSSLAELMAHGTADEKADWLLLRYAEDQNLDWPRPAS